MKSLHPAGANTFLFFSLPLAALLVLTTITALVTPGFYAKETANWETQSIGQDIVDLFLVTPFLLVTAVLAARGSRGAAMLWSGALLYLVYTYLIYCFALHFNPLFPVYCIMLGLSFYALVWYFSGRLNRENIATLSNARPAKVITIYFFIIAVGFYALWLLGIIPAIASGTIPGELADTGLPVNPVHVIDLSLVLPGIFITALLLRKRRPAGLQLTPAILVFFILMDVTIAFLSFSMSRRGIESNLAVAWIMCALALFSTVMLAWYMKHLQQNELRMTTVLVSKEPAA